MKQILVVDDDTIMRETIRDILLFEGYGVLDAMDGIDAERVLKDKQFDLIITDVLMPSRDGFEIITSSKQSFPDVKIIAVSGGGYVSADAYLRKALELGADAVIGKPFDVDDFVRIVKEQIGD